MPGHVSEKELQTESLKGISSGVDSGANVGSKDFGAGGEDRPSPSGIMGTGSVLQSKGFKDFLSNTGRSDKDPYGDRGVFSGLAKKMGFTLDYTNNMTPAQIAGVNMKAYQRYADFGSIDPISQGRRFGRPFGSSVGEMTAEGPVRKLIPTAPMSGAEMGARLGFSALGPLGPAAALADRRGTKFAPLGSTEYAEATSSGDFFDPQETNYLNQGIFSQGLDLLTGGAGSSALSRSLEGVGSLFNPEQEAEEEAAAATGLPPDMSMFEERRNTVEEGSAIVKNVKPDGTATSVETGNTVTVTDDSSDMDMFAERRNRVPNMVDAIKQQYVQPRVSDVFSPMTEPTSLDRIKAMNKQIQSSIEDQNRINRSLQFQQDVIDEARRASGLTIDPDVSGFGQSQLASGILQNTTNTASSVTPPVPLSSFFGPITNNSFSDFGPNM